VGKPEDRRTLGRPRRRWVDNIKMHILEIGWGGVDWIGLAQNWTGGELRRSRALQEKKRSGSGTGSIQPREYN
jgi:hypothetical protein